MAQQEYKYGHMTPKMIAEELAVITRYEDRMRMRGSDGNWGRRDVKRDDVTTATSSFTRIDLSAVRKVYS
jgi:hypothetical protein